jgi:hypothetical protein
MTAQEHKDELLKEWPQGYVTAPGKFEGEPIEVLYFHDLLMNGVSGETLYDGDMPIDVFFVDEDDRLLWGLDADTYAVTLWESEQGFVYHKELTLEDYTKFAKLLEETDDVNETDTYDVDSNDDGEEC